MGALLDTRLDAHLAPLAPGWALWRDIAVRSTGFPVDGLDAFGGEDESARLARVAADPRFREAVTWQNRTARANSVDKIAVGSPMPGSKRRQREDLVANYWQRYCAKNDTIGFFGPLGWGRVVDDGPALKVRAGVPDGARRVHFEVWGVQAVLDAFGLDVDVPLGANPELDARALLDALPRSPARDAAMDALTTLEGHRDTVADATDVSQLDEAMRALDRSFEAITSMAATRRPGEMYATRTLLYLDCMRDVDLTVGPGVVDELAQSLPALLAGGRWYCGQVFALARCMIAEAVADAGGRGPAAPVVGPLVRHFLDGPSALGGIVAELQRRWAELFADPDQTTLVARAERVFDGPRGWPMSVYHCPDVQIAARSVAAVEDGDFLCVLGDHHAGTNVLGQGLFARRHPDRERFLAQLRADAGRFPFLVPARDAAHMSGRVMPAVTRPDDVHITALGSVAPLGHRHVDLADLILDGSDLVDRSGTVRVPIEEAVQHVLFTASVLAYDPFPVIDHGERITIGRTVLRRATWNVEAERVPRQTAEIAGWARSLALPRRVFILSPRETKPVYVDLQSDALTRILCRQARRLATDRPDARLRITEMLPGPEQCWFTDEEGQRYTSELRFVAVDLDHRRQHETSVATDVAS